LGGRRAAVVTALVSALSLDFFLTQPYLRLTIAGKHDIIAFLGLAVCGLIAAALRTHGRGRLARMEAACDHLDLLHETLRHVEGGGSLERVLAQILDKARTALPLAALAVRDEAGRVLAASGSAQGGQPSGQELLRDTLLPRDASLRVLPRGDLPLPSEGGCLPLMIGDRRIGWLDLWGNGAPAEAEDRHTLSDLGRLVSSLLVAGPHADASSE